MTILLMIHSWLRWLIVLVAVVAAVKFLVGWLRRSAFQGMDRGLMAGFSGLMDLQAALGVILLLWSGFAGVGFPAYRLVHGLIMILAVATAHMSARWRNSDDVTRFRNNLFLILGALVLVLIGISILPRGLHRL